MGSRRPATGHRRDKWPRKRLRCVPTHSRASGQTPGGTRRGPSGPRPVSRVSGRVACDQGLSHRGWHGRRHCPTRAWPSRCSAAANAGSDDRKSSGTALATGLPRPRRPRSPSPAHPRCRRLFPRAACAPRPPRLATLGRPRTAPPTSRASPRMVTTPAPTAQPGSGPRGASLSRMHLPTSARKDLAWYRQGPPLSLEACGHRDVRSGGSRDATYCGHPGDAIQMQHGRLRRRRPPRASTAQQGCGPPVGSGAGAPTRPATRSPRAPGLKCPPRRSPAAGGPAAARRPASRFRAPAQTATPGIPRSASRTRSPGDQRCPDLRAPPRSAPSD